MTLVRIEFVDSADPRAAAAAAAAAATDLGDGELDKDRRLVDRAERRQLQQLPPGQAAAAAAAAAVVVVVVVVALVGDGVCRSC